MRFAVSMLIIFLTMIPPKARACADIVRVGPFDGAVAAIRAAIVKGESPYHSQSFYDSLSGKNEVFKALLRRWYGAEADPYISFMEQNFPPHLLPILADPGVISRFEFLKPELLKLKQARTVIELRRALEIQFQRVTIFRGLVLSEDDYKSVMSGGLKARGTVSPTMLDQISRAVYSLDSPTEDLDYPSSVLGEMHLRHIELNLENSSWMSASPLRSVAASLGYWNSGRVATEREWEEYRKSLSFWKRMRLDNNAPQLIGRRLYIFEFEVPLLDTVPIRGVFRRVDKGIAFYSAPYVQVGPEINASDAEIFVPYVLPTPKSASLVEQIPHKLQMNWYALGQENETPVFLKKRKAPGD